MKVLRSASYDEYVAWYLCRESRKRGKPADAVYRSSALSLRSEMERFHAGKIRPWFKNASWLIAEFEVHELLNIVCVDSAQTRRNRLVTSDGRVDNRLLSRVIANARKYRYFSSDCLDAVEATLRRKAIERFEKCLPELRGEERISLCSLNEEERRQNPSGTYYLNDGFGRLLAYVYLVADNARHVTSVEAFVAQAAVMVNNVRR